jgi:hypothetical protein
MLYRIVSKKNNKKSVQYVEASHMALAIEAIKASSVISVKEIVSVLKGK